MSAQDNIEKVLRDMHVLLSKSEPMPSQPGRVVVDKQKVLDLLAELNTCIYGIMDEYEMTARSRDKAEREFRKKGDEIIWNASRKAEDIYAASVMYTEEALNSLQEIMREASNNMTDIYTQMNHQLESQQKTIQTNQLELKAQLQDLRDTEKYLRLIEDRNEEILKEKRTVGKKKSPEATIYANRRTEIKVNTEVLERLGYGEALPEEDSEEAEAVDVEAVKVEAAEKPVSALEALKRESAKEEEKAKDTKVKLTAISDDDEDLTDLDLYEGKETFSNLKEAAASSKKKESGIGNMWKGLTSRL